MIGKSIAHYRITEQLGSGGMGVVYRAHDTKLGRDVALKVLPDLFAQDPERLARFEREAQLLASLNHPNIAAIYGLEESESEPSERAEPRAGGPVHCLVLELVEGETLAARLEKGALPREEALQIALQMARALESAHEKEIIHRDLKPANVCITPDGTVKVLDFGLAKALAGESETPDDLSQSPTLSPTATRAGVIMGTAAYMSPEQAKGKKVDRRADIWGFGILLLEMLTGKSTYRGETLSETMAAVMMIEPDWDALPPETPQVLRRFLKRCLRKDPMGRLRDIGDARIQIEEMLAEPEAPASVVETSALDGLAGGRAKLSWALTGVMTLVALGALVGLWRATRPVEQPAARLNVTLSPREVLFANSGPVFDLSPDGTRLVYVSGSATPGTDQGQQLYLRSLDQLDATPLSGTEGARQPFFSPDGQWVAFFASGKLKKVSVFGGAPMTLCDAPSSRGGSWGPDDTIVFAPATTTGLSRVPAAGGAPQELSVPGEGERSHRWPHVLPDGKGVLFINQASGGDNGANYDDASIEVLSLATGERKRVHQGGSMPRYLATGHLVYVREGTLFAAPFDRDRLETTGPPAPIIESVVSAGTSEGDGGAQFAFSETGTLVYLSGASLGENYELVWVDGEGAVSTLSEQPARYMTPRLSPDGRRLAVTLGAGGFGGEADIWVYDIERGAMTRLTFDPGYEAYPVWSADGERLAFVASRDGNGANLFWKRADGTGDAERLTESQNTQLLTSWSPDGNVLAFTEQDPETDWDIWVLPLDGDREPQPFQQTPFVEVYPEFSPDGRWLAYFSDESGRMEVYVKPFPGPGGKWQISTDGGRYPMWGPDGKEIFYRNPSGVLVVPYTVDGESFRAGRPRELFQGQFTSRLVPDADIAPDGKRFVMLQSEGALEAETEPTKLIFVLNGFDEIHRLVPTE